MVGSRCDPYMDFPLRVGWEGRPVAGFTTVSASDFTAVTLERGTARDVDFLRWAKQPWEPGRGSSLTDSCKDVVLDVYEKSGDIALSFNLYQCWPSEFLTVPDRNTHGDDVAIRSITLQ